MKGDDVRSNFFLYGAINDIHPFFASLCRWHEDEQIKIAIHIHYDRSGLASFSNSVLSRIQYVCTQ